LINKLRKKCALSAFLKEGAFAFVLIKKPKPSSNTFHQSLQIQ